MPMAPMTVPVASRRAEAFSVVGMPSPLAPGVRRVFRRAFYHFLEGGGELRVPSGG